MRRETHAQRIRRRHTRREKWLIFIVALFVLGIFAWGFRRPYRLWYEEKQVVHARTSERDRLRAEIAEFQRQSDLLQTDAGRVAEARRHGYILKGEQVLDIPEPPPPPPRRAPTTWERVKHFFGR